MCSTSRIVTGQLQLTILPTSLARVLNAAVETIRPAAELKGIELHCDVSEETATVNADAERLRQVFWNLLSNVRFTPHGGRIAVTTGRSKSFLFVVVSDTGIGMTPEFIPFAFDRFRQGDQSFTRPQGGLVRPRHRPARCPDARRRRDGVERWTESRRHVPHPSADSRRGGGRGGHGHR
jgi:signal transduction histidine kinase